MQKAVQRALGYALDGVIESPSMEGARGEGVNIAVIDTWPMQYGSDDPLALLRDPRFDTDLHTRHREFASAAILKPGRFHNFISGSSINAMCAQKPACGGGLEEPYPEPDHGLFIADIINDIAPRASLWVYRAFNDYGVSSLEIVSRAVAQALYDARGRPLVLNCSFGFGPEPAAFSRILRGMASFVSAYTRGDRWFRDINDAIARGRDRSAEQELLDHPMMETLRLLFDLPSFAKDMPRALAVAAAGNDSCRAQQRPAAGPRYPAAFESVLGVSAIVPTVDDTWNPAPYSNDDDIEPERDDGVSAFGGNITTGQSPNISQEGLVGLFVSNDPAWINEHGRAQWSGTSFATPIAAGLAACVWSELEVQQVADTLKTARAVMEGIVGPPSTGTPPNQPGDVRRRINLRQKIDP